MKKILLPIILVVCFTASASAQNNLKDSSLLITLNQQIDDYVVTRNIAALEKLYANDFVFSHGSGKVEGKEGWFTSVKKGYFVSRQHDSVTVEMHAGIAILRGKLSVLKKTAKEDSKYSLQYMRVYALRNKQWQMISHFTYFEVHEAG